VSKWREDIEGLAGADPLPVGRQKGQGSHVVQAVGQADEEDPDVVRHGQKHLAEVLHLLVFLGPVHTGVLDHIVQQGRGDADHVQLELGQGGCHGHRVGDVGIAREAHLAVVRPGRVPISPVDQFNVGSGRVGKDALLEGLQAGQGLSPRRAQFGPVRVKPHSPVD